MLIVFGISTRASLSMRAGYGRNTLHASFAIPLTRLSNSEAFSFAAVFILRRNQLEGAPELWRLWLVRGVTASEMQEV